MQKDEERNGEVYYRPGIMSLRKLHDKSPRIRDISSFVTITWRYKKIAEVNRVANCYVFT